MGRIMFTWIFDRIREIDQNRAPTFSSKATVNWIHAFRFEIEAEHGDNYSLQANSCRAFYNSSLKKSATNPPIGKIVEPLFFSILYCMSLQRISTSLDDISWVIPTAIIDWYYAIYFSIRSIFESNGQLVSDDHSKSAKFFACNIRQHLPYPLDICAKRNVGEKYDVFINGITNPQPYDLWRTFSQNRQVSIGMLTQYLRGTAKWEADRKKKRILLDHHEFNNFRTKQARKIRDEQLQDKISFLHCAYRQRVKANYHDSIYLAYDQEEYIDRSQFLSDLSTVSQFIAINAMTFIERRNGDQILNNFIKDLRRNLIGIKLSTQSERFWEII